MQKHGECRQLQRPPRNTQKWSSVVDSEDCSGWSVLGEGSTELRNLSSWLLAPLVTLNQFQVCMGHGDCCGLGWSSVVLASQPEATLNFIRNRRAGLLELSSTLSWSCCLLTRTDPHEFGLFIPCCLPLVAEIHNEVAIIFSFNFLSFLFCFVFIVCCFYV